MTSPYTRACRQTNFSEGGFVCKVPFLLFFYFFFFFLPSLFSGSKFFLPFLSFFQVGPWPRGRGGPSDCTGEIGSQFYVHYLPKKIL